MRKEDIKNRVTMPAPIPVHVHEDVSAQPAPEKPEAKPAVSPSTEPTRK